MGKKSYMSLGLCLVLWSSLIAADGAIDSPRAKIKINSNWHFYKGDTTCFTTAEALPSTFRKVDLPHSWNVEDPFDEEKGYYRGTGWYYKELDLSKLGPGKRTYLYLEGANQEAEVFVNGQFVSAHLGGYTAFCADLTPYLKHEGNLLAIKVDNRHNDAVVPLKGDFNFYGGIYRDVYLISVDSLHFDMSNHASPGIFITTPEVTQEKAEVHIKSNVRSHWTPDRSFEVRTTIRDHEGIQQARTTATQDQASESPIQQVLEMTQPRLWSPDDPYLYTVEVELIESGVLVDRVVQPLGLRWFRFDPNEGFFLNGQPLKLIGVNRHQDFAGMANALTDDYHVSDIEMIKSMGANFLRTAHYPQDPAVLEACDRLGLLVSMEIPLDHEIYDSPDFYANTLAMQREMIRQNYNHPSIIVWAYMNEMFLGKKWNRDSTEIKKVVSFAKDLEQLTRQEDPHRYTMIPNHGDFDVYHTSGLTQIPMIVGWNLYYGWYEKDFEGFGRFVDRAHMELPDKPLLITEYGAGADPRIRSMAPKRFDFSMEWETRFHQSHIRQIQERKFIAGSAVWNMFDFGSESRNDAVPNINSKGLCTFDRKPKDVFYLYQAGLSSEPVLELGQTHWNGRAGQSTMENGKYATQTMQVYGNVDSARLIVNDIPLSWQILSFGTSEWQVPFIDGDNQIVLEGMIGEQRITKEEMVRFQLLDQRSGQIKINLGTNFYFLAGDEQIWFPEQPYDQQWGFVGGRSFSPRDRGIGSDKNITKTQIDPVYQTQRIGLSAIRFQLPKGRYQVKVLFSELEYESSDQRIFSLRINGKKKIEKLDIVRQYGSGTAVEKTFDVRVNGKGLDIGFEAVKGEPVLNGLSIEKI